MVADTVDVHSKNAEINESFLWSSNGKDNYTIESLNKNSRGTFITLKIKNGSEEFLDSFRLRSIITKYSNYIPFPIYLKDLDNKEKEEKINEGDPLWLKDKKDIKPEDYKQFYNNISFNFDEPLKTIHYSAALLFILSHKRFIDWLKSKLFLKILIKSKLFSMDAISVLSKFLEIINLDIISENL